jgi:hypothetical protein
MIDEAGTYGNLSYEMSKCIIKCKNGNSKLSERGKIDRMNRARLVAVQRTSLQKPEAKKLFRMRRISNTSVYAGGATKVR